MNDNDAQRAKQYIDALKYHHQNPPGKIALKTTKKLVSQTDLALAYSPGVAAPCLEIKKNPEHIYKYTAKGNTVAVISNGTAVLGLGAIGARASKPVMEGKSALFKKFADIDSFDIEVNCTDANDFINTVKQLEPTWGGINLEDIKAPECFVIEEKLKILMDIPVFHDDQHGTAIITGAGLINAVFLTKRKMSEIQVVVNGAGAAAMSCINLAIGLGVKKENIILCDTQGVIYQGRIKHMNKWKQEKAVNTTHRTLEEAMVGADVFLGLSVKDVVTKEMVASMAQSPIIFAMANPDPEITPEDILSVRDDAIIATGRSDYNNQINNVMGFPYIFRGALDVRAKSINEEMKLAAAKALAKLARQPVPWEVYKAYEFKKKSFGPDYIIPVPFDPRLITTVPVAVAQAAINSGVARIKNLDMNQYKVQLRNRINPTEEYMHTLYEEIYHAKKQRIILSKGNEEEIIKTAIIMRDKNYATPIIVGCDNQINLTLNSMNSGFSLTGIKITNAMIDKNTNKYIDKLYKKLHHKGYSLQECTNMVKENQNIFSACMIENGDADAMITTADTEEYYNVLNNISEAIDIRVNTKIMSYYILFSNKHKIIMVDNTIFKYSKIDDLLNITIESTRIAESLGLKPRVAFINFTSFNIKDDQKIKKIKQVIYKLDKMHINFEYDGEITTIDTALNPRPSCKLSGPANILIILDDEMNNSAQIATHMLQAFTDGTFLGPVLSGFKYPIQIIPSKSSISASEIIKFITFATIESIKKEHKKLSRA